MSSTLPNDQQVRNYFEGRLHEHGATPRGVDWNSESAQETRFEQLLKVCDRSQPFSLLDYGSGYGALADYLLRQGYPVSDYMGYDLLENMATRGRELHPDMPQVRFSADASELVPADFVIASGIFNIRLEATQETWTRYVISELHKMDRLSRRGLAFNLLTMYSDPEYMRPHLYYADPCYLFDYCKRNFSRNVALLHDYGRYDFTIIVRKELPQRSGG